MFGQPAFVTTEKRGDPQGQALFPEQRIPAVPGSDRNDLVRFRKVADVTAFRITIEDRVGPPVKVISRSEMVVRCFPHPRHDPHTEDDIDGVGDFQTHLGQRRSLRPHQIRNDEKRPSLHRPGKHAAQFLPHALGFGPVVRRTRLLLPPGADVGALLDSGHVVWVGVMIVGAGPLLGIQRDQHPLFHCLLRQIILLCL